MTSSQFFSHFLRHVNGRAQVWHILVGKSCFLTPFDAILLQFGLKEAEVIALMRREMKPSSWRMWRARVQGRATKHSALRGFEVGRHKYNLQRQITGNKISKR